MILHLAISILLAHQFHVSKSLIEYNTQDQALQISMHIFIDDLEEALRQRGADQLYICTKKEAPKAEFYMEQYLRKQFQLTLNGEEVEYVFLGKEISDDLAAVWCYLEIPNVSAVKSLAIKNQILLDIYDDQKNITHIIGPGGKEGFFMFQRDNPG